MTPSLSFEVKKPDTTELEFFCVGPQRTGSTWLYEQLAQHPEICFPATVKETFFFDRWYEQKGYDWYLDLFQPTSPKQIKGEVGPSYFDSGDALFRILKHCPTSKILICVRNPVSRTYSVFKHYYNTGRVPGDFQKAIEQEPRIVDSGHYRKYSRIWETAFEGRVCYVVQDDVIADPQAVLDAVCDFLEVHRMPLPEGGEQPVNEATAPRFPWLIHQMQRVTTRLHAMGLTKIVDTGKRIGLRRLYQGGRQLPALTEAQRQALRQEFEADICWLQEKLNRDFSSWR